MAIGQQNTPIDNAGRETVERDGTLREILKLSVLKLLLVQALIFQKLVEVVPDFWESILQHKNVQTDCLECQDYLEC